MKSSGSGQGSGRPVNRPAAMSRVGDEKRVLDYAVSIGANSIELPAGYTSWPRSVLVRIAGKLAANPLPS